MPKSTASSNDTLNANLRAVDPAWRANVSRWVALYTITPGVGGSANTNEATDASYARVLVTAATGFTAAAGASSSNVAAITFPEYTTATESITYCGIVETASGAGTIIYFGALTTPRSMSPGITPNFAIGALVATEA